MTTPRCHSSCCRTATEADQHELCLFRMFLAVVDDAERFGLDLRYAEYYAANEIYGQDSSEAAATRRTLPARRITF